MKKDTDRLRTASDDDWWEAARQRVNDPLERVAAEIGQLKKRTGLAGSDVCRRRGHGVASMSRMVANRTVYHVVPDSDGEQWVVTQERSEFREEYHTKAGAVGAAKMRARAAEPSQVKVHTRDGDMEYESTYGDDPHRSPD